WLPASAREKTGRVPPPRTVIPGERWAGGSTAEAGRDAGAVRTSAAAVRVAAPAPPRGRRRGTGAPGRCEPGGGVDHFYCAGGAKSIRVPDVSGGCPDAARARRAPASGAWAPRGPVPGPARSRWCVARRFRQERTGEGVPAG